MLMKPLFILILLTLVVGIQECEQLALQQRMASFDKALIPLWVHLKEQDIYQAKPAVFNTAFRWQQMKNQVQDAYPERADWAPTFERVDAWLDDAYYAIDANCADIAINQLQHVRYEMATLRSRYKVPYYFDQLYTFEDHLATTREVTDDVLLCLLEWQELELLVRDMNIAWGKLRQFPLDGEIYGLNEAELQQVGIWEKEVEERLDYFNQELACANREEVAVAAYQVDKSFLGLLRVWGELEINKSYFSKRWAN